MQEAPASLRDAVKRELAAERVLWAGMPSRLGYAERAWGTAALGFLFTVVAGFITFMAIVDPRTHADRALIFLPQILFPAIGLTMLLTPLFLALRAHCVYYVVTERRALIFQKHVRLKIHSFPVSGFGGYERISHGGDSGDIIFRREVERGSKGGQRTTDTGFLGLKNVFRAEKALEEMLERAKRT